MSEFDRRTFIQGLGASVALASGLQIIPRSAAGAGDAVNPHLTRIHPEFLIQPNEVRALHARKDAMGGPTFAGSPSWQEFVDLVKYELRDCGVVDIARSGWTYQRWSTTEWPDDSNWSLNVDGKKIKVASCGCYSGKTPDEGVTGELVVYKRGMAPAELKGKIALVLKPSFEQDFQIRQGKLQPKDRPINPLYRADYEYLSNPETFAEPLMPMSENVWVSPFPEMGLGVDLAPLVEAGAVGALILMGLSYDALAGTYTFPVPVSYNLPTLYIDRETGYELLEAANHRKSATLRLISHTEEAEAYQLFGYLPGKNYGKPDDEQILLITHTDGPSISQENGALGILGMVKYFANIPQADRPRTLMIFFDCRHYMPGGEKAFEAQDYVKSHPDLYKKVVAAMGIEHLGQIKVADEQGKSYHRTDQPEISSLWITKNQRLVDIAVKAVKDNKLERVQVQCPDRPGSHGKPQGRQYGLGAIAGVLKVPGASTMGLMSAYWSTKARMDYLDASHFVAQVATMSQICGELMAAELTGIKST